VESDPNAGFPRRFGKYLLLSRMAVGGMAELFLAVEETEHAGRRFVTVKRIRPEYARDADYIEFFLTEGRVALKCTHPHLPQAFDLGVIGGVHFLAMEFIRGHTLLDVVRAAATAGKSVTVATALRIGISIAAALECVHGLCDVDGRPLHVVHRDVTPQNIMISSAGSVKLIDFGIVRSDVQTHRTQNGVVKGKFAYLAPESIVNRGRIDQRADIFSLGICMHETLTARPLFRGINDAATLERLRFLEIPDLSLLRADVPTQLSAAVLKALERKPKRRFQSATEFLSALEQVTEECGIFHSVTRLRDEVLSLCGSAPLPMLAPEVLEALSAEVANTPPPVGLNPHATLPPGAARDPRLAYFLAKASARPLPTRRPPTHDDPDLAELLSTLDR
jgi:serine/threonine-protein kinase